ncbi:flippase-like domain-containing protein [Candidatus Halobonum tyrrellensis]|uniref:Dolichol-P-glucose synthetase n=1 Tax=Candidatus Halobonum tyrrellensis G22 TaxID=1324957 RepID=V4GTB4_9EURY|nr:flippase-like domain-containing protein [Candidatus Halobonum tyrrellensis]ESP88316.1 dolichol-P-glucose synthetase [Candidatus Halobonum tyrrellensis G22]
MSGVGDGGAGPGAAVDRTRDREASVEVSVVLPAYNEEESLESTVRTTIEALERFLPADAFEVVVAEDGCDDRTPEIADRLAAADARVRHLHSDSRLGRGGALSFAFERAAGDTLVYFDTDMATDVRHLESLVERVRSGGYDVATGSRWMPGARVDRPTKRSVPSRGFNAIVRTLLRSDVRDHQCGFKAVSREAFEALADDIEDDHWFWDTELLVRAQRAGLRVDEFAVDWEPKDDSKVDLVRDVFGMGSQVVRLFWQLSVSPHITRGRTVGAGVVLTLAALALMTVYLDPSAVVEAFTEADPRPVALAAVVYALSWPLRGMRYRDILSELGYDESVGFLTGAVFISQTGNLVFPARAGDAVRAYVVKARRAIPYPTGVASLAAERVFDLLTITAMAGTVLLGLLVTGNTADIAAAVSGNVGGEFVTPGAVRTAVRVAAVVGVVAAAGLLAIVASARTDRNYIRAVVSRFSSDSYVDYVVGVVEEFVAGVQTVAGRRSSFLRVGAASVAVWTLDVVTALLVLGAFPDALASMAPVQFLAVGFFAVSVGNLAKVLPLSPGGIGLYEAAFTAFVVGLGGAPPAVAFAAAVLDHAVKNVVTVVGGVGSMLGLNVSLTAAVDGSEELDADADVTPVDD